jgi:CxxC-x17-CxxC domain-containing protein
MGDYNRSGRRGRDSRRSGGDFRRRDSGPREMFEAVCDECGKSCEVPFRPSEDKPIYCADCFERKGGRSSRGSAGKGGNSERVLIEQFGLINEKLDRIMVLLEAGKKAKVSKKKVVD